MRIIAPALLLLAGSCGQGEAPEQRNGPANQVGPQIGARAGVTVTLAATGPEGCAATWGGEAVPVAQLSDRSHALIMRAADALGGIQNLRPEDFPTVTVQAPAELGFACADTALAALQRGAAMVALQVPGRAPVPADFPLEMNAPLPPVPMVLGIGAGGQVTWNGNPVDAAGLATELGRIGSTAPAEPGELGPPPGAGPELRIAREANFGQVYELLRTTRRYNLRPFVYLPSAEAAPPPAARPAAPSVAPPLPPVPPPPPPR